MRPILCLSEPVHKAQYKGSERTGEHKILTHYINPKYFNYRDENADNANKTAGVSHVDSYFPPTVAYETRN
jgi:hypothetical protein